VTPFGARLRALRDERGVTLSALAAALQVSAAYLSALEHGRRGLPSAGLIQQLNEYFSLWDDELTRLARMSHPRVVVDTGGLSPEATELANRLALRIRAMTPAQIQAMRAAMEAEPES
jgi:transcriptional regulator with XRE-family HTH domain